MLRRSLLALTILATIGTSGCFRGGPELGLRVLGAVAAVAVHAAVHSSSSSSGPSRPEYSSCCYSRENATPVEGAVDRPMSECELARGHWRETHQDEDLPPPRLRCLADGSYPMEYVGEAPTPVAPAPPAAEPAPPPVSPPPSAQPPAAAPPPDMI